MYAQVAVPGTLGEGCAYAQVGVRPYCTAILGLLRQQNSATETDGLYERWRVTFDPLEGGSPPADTFSPRRRGGALRPSDAP